ncbi:MAG TPA: hypothetical protein VE593_12895 [Nitrososphaeraceae archaeon]|nr:hypothetical protein [Nitrososphaeraceae archaeon]
MTITANPDDNKSKSDSYLGICKIFGNQIRLGNFAVLKSRTRAASRSRIACVSLV